ncbi:glycoside hydrolase family 43 protein [Rathayibacter sp. SD072]|uniref:glycoside hydrolase family 43 protein n=1 Tax=Rathayibacter sp. SD072 TaxID=2781731 RepID=UPI001A9591ED|nr:glycoside hydrolase family 43 protein [Rathayibacter sp. SD072]MBO0984567.1 glycoside hydrolase family 43 protein [Rathayibacter sp. SD072]
MAVFTNPVLPGFHPDPSVCRVDDDYYLVVSSFAYLPGIPVFHSTDLVSWTPLGHVFDRPGVIDLDGLDVSDGLWAPTIRHHRGVFYVVTTIARERQGIVTLLATATDPAGPWSDPVTLDAEGIDPSLFFDDDGRCWFTGCRDTLHPAVGGPGELWMRELDLDTLSLTGPTHVLWHGAVRGAWVEGPHIHRRGDEYFLVAAEGGTEGNHSVTVARAATVTGPYVGDPRNPLLTHRHHVPEEPIQNVGHADLVDTVSGETWAVLLGTRPTEGHHVLGREVFLVPVTWSSAGPVFAPGSGRVRSLETRPRASAGNGTVELRPQDQMRRSGFGQDASGVLPPEWLSLRALPPLCDNGVLVLPAGSATLADRGRPSFVGCRQTSMHFTARLVVDFAPLEAGEEAGLALHQGERGHVTATVRLGPEGRELVLSEFTDGVRSESAVSHLPDGDVEILVNGTGLDYTFSFRPSGQPVATRLGCADGRLLSTQTAGGFVGVLLGPYATANGRPSTTLARFSDFGYSDVSEEEGARSAFAESTARLTPVV